MYRANGCPGYEDKARCHLRLAPWAYALLPSPAVLMVAVFVQRLGLCREVERVAAFLVVCQVAGVSRLRVLRPKVPHSLLVGGHAVAVKWWT
jgi:lipopolysaccharide export LptBFGC system permease protein LptF